MPHQPSASPQVAVSVLLALAFMALPSAQAQDIDAPLRARLRDTEAGRERLLAQALGLQAIAPAMAGAPVWPQALVALRIATLDAFALAHAARAGAIPLDLPALEVAPEREGLEVKPLRDFFAEAEAKQAADRPGAGWPFPIDRLINGVAWFCTEAPWWVVVLVALPFIVVGIRYLRSLSRARKALRSR